MTTKEILEYLLTPAAQVALIIGLCEFAKAMGLNKRYVPILDLALGIVSGLLVYGIEYGLINGLVIGIAIGLSACGLFSGIKNVIGR